MVTSLLAGGLAGLAALSLLLGAGYGMVRQPSTRVVAIIMAFGSGALIHAVVTELAANPSTELVLEHGYESRTAWLITALGFVVGGLVYVWVNVIVEQHGGGVHRRHDVRRRALDEKRHQLAPILEALAGTEIARHVAPEDAEVIVTFLRPREVAAGDVIYRPGEPSDALFIVQRGEFSVRSADATGADPAAPLILHPGDVIGGLGMLGGEPRTAMLTADQPGVLLALTRADLQHVLEQLPHFRATVTDMVAKHLLSSAQRHGQADATQWYRVAISSLQNLSPAETDASARRAAAASPLAIFIGTLQDGIPESLAIGATFTTLAAFNPTFLVAVLLSNLPEAVSGTSAMLRAGMSRLRIFLMWLGLVAGSTVAGIVGHILLNDASPGAVVLLMGFAGGGVVAMLATTMMTEAFEGGG
ncbi:MAG: cyclic nucleotide-binding domain-containing protein, partial [Chloroflexota bacterium]